MQPRLLLNAYLPYLLYWPTYIGQQRPCIGHAWVDCIVCITMLMRTLLPFPRSTVNGQGWSSTRIVYTFLSGCMDAARRRSARSNGQRKEKGTRVRPVSTPTWPMRKQDKADESVRPRPGLAVHITVIPWGGQQASG